MKYLIVIFLLLSFQVHASRYGGDTTIINNYTDNTFVDKSSEAMGACALGQAASQFHPSVFSKHHQYGVGAGYCDGDTSEQAVNLGYAYVVDKRKTHVDMFSGNVGYSTDDVFALGVGWNSHFD